jgi:hypothetical protein
MHEINKGVLERVEGKDGELYTIRPASMFDKTTMRKFCKYLFGTDVVFLAY